MKLTDRVLETSPVDLKRVLVWIVIAVPFAAAWLVGKAVLALMVVLSWIKAACVEGYRVAKGDQ